MSADEETKTHRYTCIGCGVKEPCIIDVVMKVGTKVNLHNLPRFCPVGKGRCKWETPRQLSERLACSADDIMQVMKSGTDAELYRSKRKKSKQPDKTEYA